MQLKLLLSLYFLTNITFNFALGVSLLKKYDKLHKKLNRMLNRPKGNYNIAKQLGTISFYKKWLNEMSFMSRE